jgi:hypothetical protein
MGLPLPGIPPPPLLPRADAKEALDVVAAGSSGAAVSVTASDAQGRRPVA